MVRSTEALQAVYFLVPPLDSRFGVLPESPADYWAWVSGQRGLDAWGPFSWTLQTYLQLLAHGFPVSLTRDPPEEGIVIAHRDFLPDSLVPAPRQFVVCILADRGEPGFGGRHPWAQFHVVQNPADPLIREPHQYWPAGYMPYWPQPGMIPRDPKRGAHFSAAAFIGYEHNLATELREPEWAAQLAALGLQWTVPHRSQWHNYSAIDVIVAARSFGGGLDYCGKPPSKLHNAWLAGVPAVLGRESAFQSVRCSPLDYIEVDSATEAIAAVRMLSETPGLRKAMIANGLARARALHPAALSARWKGLITEILAPAHARWVSLEAQGRLRFFDARRDVYFGRQREAHEETYSPQDLANAEEKDRTQE